MKQFPISNNYKENGAFDNTSAMTPYMLSFTFLYLKFHSLQFSLHFFPLVQTTRSNNIKLIWFDASRQPAAPAAQAHHERDRGVSGRTHLSVYRVPLDSWCHEELRSRFSIWGMHWYWGWRTLSISLKENPLKRSCYCKEIQEDRESEKKNSEIEPIRIYFSEHEHSQLKLSIFSIKDTVCYSFWARSLWPLWRWNNYNSIISVFH